MRVRPVSEATTEQVRDALLHAMDVMRDAGFGITRPVEVVVDPQLPFMGYTMPQGDNFRIVTSGMAVESGILEGLLVHELSHIYRMQTNHPSHDGQLIEEVISGLGRRALSPDYKLKIIRDLVNDIEDLYADDIAVKVIIGRAIVSEDQMTEFLQGWVKDEPVKSNYSVRHGWVNTSMMAKSARAISQMIRHGIVDKDGKAANSNMRFLSRLSPEKSIQFEYFKSLLTNLKEDSNREEYRRFLDGYLRRFVEIAEA
jgi:hypothetical protein